MLCEIPMHVAPRIKPGSLCVGVSCSFRSSKDVLLLSVRLVLAGCFSQSKHTICVSFSFSAEKSSISSLHVSGFALTLRLTTSVYVQIVDESRKQSGTFVDNIRVVQCLAGTASIDMSLRQDVKHLRLVPKVGLSARLPSSTFQPVTRHAHQPMVVDVPPPYAVHSPGVAGADSAQKAPPTIAKPPTPPANDESKSDPAESLFFRHFPLGDARVLPVNIHGVFLVKGNQLDSMVVVNPAWRHSRDIGDGHFWKNTKHNKLIV